MKIINKKLLQHKGIIAVVLIVLITAALGGAKILKGNNKTRGFYSYENLSLAKKYLVIHENQMSFEEQVMVQTLQGILAQNKSETQIFIDSGDNYKKWLEGLKSKYSIEYIRVNSAWDIVDLFKDNIKEKGFIVYKAGTRSVNVACTLSGITNYISVDESLVSKATEHGLVSKMDVSDKNEKWVFDNYKDKLNNKLLVRQSTEKSQVRDYGVANKALFYYGEGTADITAEVLSWVEDGSPIFGWGPGDEMSHVSAGSDRNLFTIPSDWSDNLSIFSAINKKELKQAPIKNSVDSSKKDVHYVTFVMSDGDNVQWYENDFAFSSKWYGASSRGKIPMGWSINPSLIELASNIMEDVYQSKTDNDYFVGAVSGCGYMYPNSYSKEKLEEHCKELNKLYERTNLEYVQILDYKFDNSTLEKYAKQKNIKGGMLMTYDNMYAGKNGEIAWVNDKPFVAVRDSLWETDPVKLAEKINKYPKDPKHAEGYTLVNVHPWSSTYDDVIKLSEKLDKNVQVVSPKEFMELIKKNVQK